MMEVALPRLSDSMEEGTLIKWLKHDGERVAAGDELVEVETDKATVTVSAEEEGVLAAIGGLFLTFFTDTGEASLGSANSYTLFSIAAVVIGGVSLLGGRGSAIGAVFGAFAFRSIGDLLFVFNVDALWQPLFQGVILLLAVAIGACGLFRVRNRLEWFQ